MSGHNWSGWPGAWCLDCGIEDPQERALALNYLDPFTGTWDTSIPEAKKLLEYSIANKDCSEPYSNKHNPYKMDKP